MLFECPRGCPFSFAVIVSQSCVKEPTSNWSFGTPDQGRADWMHMLFI